jgi:hypothetical protein
MLPRLSSLTSHSCRQDFIDHLMEPYARAQLESGCLHQLGAMAARFRFRLVRWLRGIRATCVLRTCVPFSPPMSLFV